MHNRLEELCHVLHHVYNRLNSLYPECPYLAQDLKIISSDISMIADRLSIASDYAQNGYPNHRKSVYNHNPIEGKLSYDFHLLEQ